MYTFCTERKRLVIFVKNLIVLTWLINISHSNMCWFEILLCFYWLLPGIFYVSRFFWVPMMLIYFVSLFFVFVGLSVITKKLNGILPILVGCFQDFVPLVHTSLQLDAQSFDCMLSVLQSIDLIVQFFAYGTEKSQQELQISLLFYTQRGMSHYGQDNVMVMLKKLWDVFPLYPAHQLSEKVMMDVFICNSCSIVLILVCYSII